MCSGGWGSIFVASSSDLFASSKKSTNLHPFIRFCSSECIHCTHTHTLLHLPWWSWLAWSCQATDGSILKDHVILSPISLLNCTFPFSICTNNVYLTNTFTMRLDSIAVISSHLGSNVRATLSYREACEFDSRRLPVFSDNCIGLMMVGRRNFFKL